jgi:hypothetical protein
MHSKPNCVIIHTYWKFRHRDEMQWLFRIHFRKLCFKKCLQQTYDTEKQTNRTLSVSYLSTVVLNANQPNTCQVTFVDVTVCCGVKVSFEYSAPRLQNMKSTTKRCVSGIWVRGGAVGRGTVLKRGRSRVRIMMGSLESFIDLILPSTLWTCDHLSLWQNK